MVRVKEDKHGNGEAGCKDGDREKEPESRRRRCRRDDDPSWHWCELRLDCDFHLRRRLLELRALFRHRSRLGLNTARVPRHRLGRPDLLDDVVVDYQARADGDAQGGCHLGDGREPILRVDREGTVHHREHRARPPIARGGKRTRHAPRELALDDLLWPDHLRREPFP